MRAIALGAGVEQSPFISIVSSLGVRVLAMDERDDAEGFKHASQSIAIDIMDRDKVLDIAHNFRPDFVVPAPMARPLITCGVINDHFKLKGVSEKAARLVNDKKAFNQLMSNIEIKVAKQKEITGQKSLENAVQELGLPFVIKPRSGSGSRNVRLIMSKGELPLKFDRGFLAEQSLEGQEYGVDGFILNNRVRILSVRKKSLTPPPYRQAVSYFVENPALLRHLNEIITTLEKALTALESNDVIFHSDIMMTKNGKVSLIELSPRPAGHGIHSHLLPVSYGKSLIKSFISEVYLNKKPEHLKFRNNAFLSFFPIREGRVLQVPDTSNDFFGDKNIKFEANLRVGDFVQPFIDGSSAMQRGFIVMPASDRKKGEYYAKLFARKYKIERSE